MPLNLVAPGTRKGNKFYLARGSVLGTLYEFNCYTIDPKLANKRLVELEDEIRRDVVPSGDKLTIAEAARLYIEFRDPALAELQRIDKVVAQIGNKRIQQIRPADLHDLALRMYPNAAAATRNRWVLRPIVTILHHCANAGLCPWIKVPAFKEPRPVTRALDPAAAAALIQAAPAGPQRALLTWLFMQGTRITATLKLDWSQIDLEKRTVRLFNKKGDRFETFPLHDAVIAELGGQRSGRVFPWRDRSSLRHWLPQICARAGVEDFTPHMARHTLGTLMAANGETLAAIMRALGHSQAASSLRYQGVDVEVVRAATARVRLPVAAAN